MPIRSKKRVFQSHSNGAFKKTTLAFWLTAFFVSSFLVIGPNYESFAAAIFDPETQPAVTLAPFELKNTNLAQGNTKAYRPWFENGAWQGDVIEYDLNSDGTLQTDVVVGANPPSAPGSNWSARATFETKEADNINYWDTERKIITSITGVDQQPFRWDSLTDPQKQAVDSLADVNDTQNDILDFVRGDRGREGNGFRIRLSILGDIIDSAPVYVGAPSAGYLLPGYAQYATDNATRAGRVYVGVNDAMVHSFDANDGSEEFAYVPSIFFAKLKNLTRIPYAHSYFGNGELVATDAKVGPDWKTLLAGGFGPGEQGLFVLDITDPALSSESAASGSDKKILFEKDAGSDANLGHIYGPPALVLLPDNQWYLAAGNGYGSINETASLYLVRLDSPFAINKIFPDNTIVNNGLSAPTFVDINSDTIADIAYAGDLQGNLWKFEFSIVSSGLSVSTSKLFAAGSNQPITVAPEVGIHPSGGHLIFFGTGSLLSGQDASNLDQQSIYAVRDSGALIDNQCFDGSSGALLCQELTEITHPQGTEVRVSTSAQPDWNVHKGWKVDLPGPGERLIGHPRLRNGRLQFVSSDVNANGVENWFFQLNFLSGGDTDAVLFDVDSDGSFNSSDQVDVSGAPTNPVAINLGLGNFSQPVLATVDNTTDAVFINGLLQPNPNSICTGSCLGGIAAGPVDVNTDTAANGLGGPNAGHSDGYDDQFDVTFFDYFELLDSANLALLSSLNIDSQNQKLIAVITNADLSPGGTITVGDKSWNVVEYQKLIQQKLALWNGISELDLVDDDGDPLFFTLNQINSAEGGTGTLRLSFDNDAILRGGIIPTRDACVDDPVGNQLQTNGRWRGGALTLQILDFAGIQNSINSESKVFQFPAITDLPVEISLPSGTIILEENPDSDGDGILSYGGVIANPDNADGFIYESTVFWDYLGACYGTQDWETDRANSTFTDEEIGQLQTEKGELINDIINFECEQFDANGQCVDPAFLSLLEDLKAALDELNAAVSGYKGGIAELAAFIAEGGLDDLTSTSNNPAGPAEPGDRSQGLPSPRGLGSGARFREGRQSWLSISLDAL